jgi:hypothetical protein
MASKIAAAHLVHLDMDETRVSPEVFMRRTMLIGMTALVAGVMGCSGGDIGAAEGVPQTDNTQPTDDPNSDLTSALVIDENTGARVAGHIQTSAGVIAFVAIRTDATHITVKITINGKTFDGALDADTTVIDGHDAVLTVAEKEFLKGFSEALAEKIDMPEESPQIPVYRFAALLSIAPNGFVHRRLETSDTPVAALGAPPDSGVWGNEGKTCIKIGTIVNTSYTANYKNDAGKDLGNSYLLDPIKVGSDGGKIVVNGKTNDYSCMGRCGAGCSGIGGGWTKDCLDHDTCSLKYKASGGASDPNCGNEYNEASDDIFASCTGK